MARSEHLSPRPATRHSMDGQEVTNSLLLATLAQPSRQQNRLRVRRGPQQIPTIFISLPDGRLEVSADQPWSLSPAGEDEGTEGPRRGWEAERDRRR